MLSEDYVVLLIFTTMKAYFILCHFIGFSIEICNCFGDNTSTKKNVILIVFISVGEKW